MHFKIIPFHNKFTFHSGNWQSDSPWYRSDNIFGEDAYLTTAYFVNPDVICSTGRSQSDFDVEGTGNTLLFLKEQDLIAVPLDVDSTDGSVNSLKFSESKAIFIWNTKISSNFSALQFLLLKSLF